MELKQLNSCTIEKKSDLLIVPYGIETVSLSTNGAHTGLLIVPYGIETWTPPSLLQLFLPFNRTLWN